MITPGEEALLILIISATILLFNFSTLSAMAAIQEEAAQKTAVLRADKLADLLANGLPPEGMPTNNASVTADGHKYGGEEGESYVEARRFRYSGGRLVQVRVRAW